ncbi:MAG: phasin family protein [Betaproteobacteria bacterium]|nr:phasin family protein [Betaproteobacteria bacterium]
MQRQSIHFQPNQLSDAALAASRQMWLASLGAAVVTRDWVQNEAGTVLKTLVKEGTAVESRAIRFVGDRLEGSVERANTLWRRTRHTVETTVRAYADTAVTIVRETLPKALPKIDLPIIKRAEARAKRAATVKRARKVAKAAKTRTTKVAGKAKRAVKKAAAARA